MATLNLNRIQIKPVWGEDFDEKTVAEDVAVMRKIESSNPGAPTARFYKSN